METILTQHNTDAIERKHSWPMVRLGEVCEFSRGLTYSKSDEVQFSLNVVLRSNNVDLETGRLVLDELKYIRDSIEIPTSKRVAKGAILMCTANGSKQHLGKVALIDGDYNYAFGGFMGLLTPNASIDSRYLYWQLMSFEFKRLVTTLTDGANINNLKFADISQFTFLLPPLTEQKEIVARLERELAAVEKMKKGFEALAETAKAEFKAELKEVFESGELRVESGELAVRRVKLGEICEFMTSGSRGWAKYYSDSGELFITIKNVKDCAIDVHQVQHVKPPNGAETERTRVKEGDLLISITADLGRTGVVTKAIEAAGAYINQHLICIRLKKDMMLPMFAAYYVESEDGKKQIAHRNKEAVKAGLNFASVSSILLPFPSLPVQRQIVDRLSAAKVRVEKLEAKAREGVAVCETMRKAILKEAFAPCGAGEVA